MRRSSRPTPRALAYRWAAFACAPGHTERIRAWAPRKSSASEGRKSLESRRIGAGTSDAKSVRMRDDDILLKGRAHRGSGSATPVTRTPMRRDDDMVFKRRPRNTPAPESAEDDRQG